MNYGMGGHYSLHHDFVKVSNIFEVRISTRIESCVMITTIIGYFNFSYNDFFFMTAMVHFLKMS